MKCCNCRMTIPNGAKICPYCRSKQNITFGPLGDFYDGFKESYKKQEAKQRAALGQDNEDYQHYSDEEESESSYSSISILFGGIVGGGILILGGILEGYTVMLIIGIVICLICFLLGIAKNAKAFIGIVVGLLILFFGGKYLWNHVIPNGSNSKSQTEIANSVATDNKTPNADGNSVAKDNETPIADGNSLIADFDENMVYQGEYVFDAVLTDATLEKKQSTFTIKIDGNKVSIPTDEGKTMTGFIYNDNLGIDALYDYGDDLHWISMSLKPNDREGKEWVGEYAFTGMRFDAVLKLKEVKRKGEAVKVTEERTDD